MNDFVCAGCSPGFFRDGSCVPCPRNSIRLSATDLDDKCTCSTNYARQPGGSVTNQCSRKCLVLYI